MRKMRMGQAELDKAEDRANETENKNTMLQEELKETGMNVKSLRSYEEKACNMEESYSEQLKTLKLKHEEALDRAETVERSMQKLKKDVERLEDELEMEQNKSKNLEEEMKSIMSDLNSL